MGPLKMLALMLVLTGLALAFPVWLFTQDQNLAHGTGTVIGASAHGLEPRWKKRRPEVADRDCTRLGPLSDSLADRFALDVDCQFKCPEGESKFTGYYGTYPTRKEAEAVGDSLRGKSIEVRYDPKRVSEHCVLANTVANENNLMQVILVVIGVCVVGALVIVVKAPRNIG